MSATAGDAGACQESLPITGESPSTRMSSKPLRDLLVIELGHSVAAPFGCQILGDLGAKVIKVENPSGGDDARSWGPPFWHGAAAVFQALNRNKYSVAIDLKNETQRLRLRRLILEKADVVVQNLRPGLAQRLGLGAELRRECPRLIYCNLSAFGNKGPLSQRPGYDPLMQAFAGIMSITGEEGRPPVRVGPSIIDVASGMWVAIGVLAAVHHRVLTGEGCEVNASLFETALAWVGNSAALYQASGRIPGRRGSENPSLVPYKVYQAADDYVLIAAGNDNLFRRLAGALGHPEWANDPKFATNPERVRNREWVNAAVQAVVETRSRGSWLEALEAAGVPCAPLQTIDQVLAHAQTKALGMMQPTPDGAMSLMGTPLSFDGVRPELLRAPPGLGADTDSIWSELLGSS